LRSEGTLHAEWGVAEVELSYLLNALHPHEVSLQDTKDVVVFPGVSPRAGMIRPFRTGFDTDVTAWERGGIEMNDGIEMDVGFLAMGNGFVPTGHFISA
jgi:hypothetical protein